MVKIITKDRGSDINMDIKGETIQNGEPTPEHPVDIENKINLTGAIQILNKLKSKVTLVEVDDENNSEKEYRLPFLMNIEQQAIETVLSELEKKEAIINEMAEYIDKITFVDEKEDYGCDFQLLTNVMCNHNNCKECIKEYFTNKVESGE